MWGGVGWSAGGGGVMGGGGESGGVGRDSNQSNVQMCISFTM